jgi:hypothetical protein
MKPKSFIEQLLPVIFLLVPAFGISAQSGGSYTIEQSVVANGGGVQNNTTGNIYKIEGTAGQSAAGEFALGGIYTLRNGFWTPSLLAPTAAGVSISGRVTGISGEGLRDVNVTLTGGTLITPRRARTNTFGNFTFEDVEVGQIYTISVQHRKYGFSQESQVISVLDNISDLLFRAGWEN